jgi:hypothetical protein
MKIDIFNHVAPEPFLQMVEQERPEWAAPLRRLRLLWDIEGRV